MNRLINLGLLLAFSICYMEWGLDKSMFVFQGEYEIFCKQEGFWQTITHPLILAGLIGQLLLLWCAIRKAPNKRLNWLGIIILSPVVLLILLAGMLSFNVKMLFSTLPYIALCVVFWWYNRKRSAELN